MKVGFIGLGIMGKPMCRNLMKAGYEAVVYNRSKASVEELSAEGAQADRILAEAGAQVDARWAEFQKNADALIHAHDELRSLIQNRHADV